jgi:hypothetical protein
MVLVGQHNNEWSSICWSPELSLFVAVASSGTGNRVMTSPDGINWTIRSSAADNNWKSVCWSPELSLFVAVASSGTDNRVMTSPDGTNWTIRSSAANNNWYSVCWSPELSLFVAVASTGTDNRVMTSSNGIDWTIRSSAADNNWYSVCWSPELSLFAAVAHSDNSDHIMTSPNGINWTIQSSVINFCLSYLDGPTSYLVRDQSSVHYLWRDEASTLHTAGDTTLPQWNLGYLESTDDPPATREDAYYKIFLQKAPIRLDITDADKIHFTPYWSIDPTKTIDAMMQVTEHFDPAKSPSWYQEIKSIILFNSTEGGALPSTIERVAAYTPLVSTGFDGNLTPAVNNLQAFAQAVDDLDIPAAAGVAAPVAAPTATSDFLVGAQVATVWQWVKKTLAEVKTILGLGTAAYTASGDYATAAKGVTGGDSHDHSGGDGAQIAYSALSGTPTVREMLTANRTYYVRTDGNNANTGLINDAAGAFLTIQKAIDIINSTLDIAGYTVTIKIADGTYTTPVTLKNVVGYATFDNLIIEGNTTTPANVIISTTNSNCFSATSLSSSWHIKGVKTQTTTSGNCFSIVNSYVAFSNLVFGACAGTHLSCSAGFLIALTNYAVTGNALAHIQTREGGILDVSGKTITFTGSIAFSWFCICNTVGNVQAYTMTFSGGTITGKRYDASLNGVIYVFGGGANYFPGSAPGATSSGGQYV